jgi:hypothetical protein
LLYPNKPKGTNDMNILLTFTEAEAEALRVLAAIDCRERKPFLELHLKNLLKASRDILPLKNVKELDAERVERTVNKIKNQNC